MKFHSSAHTARRCTGWCALKCRQVVIGHWNVGAAAGRSKPATGNSPSSIFRVSVRSAGAMQKPRPSESRGQGCLEQGRAVAIASVSSDVDKSHFTSSRIMAANVAQLHERAVFERRKGNNFLTSRRRRMSCSGTISKTISSTAAISLLTPNILSVETGIVRSGFGGGVFRYRVRLEFTQAAADADPVTAKIFVLFGSDRYRGE